MEQREESAQGVWGRGWQGTRLKGAGKAAKLLSQLSVGKSPLSRLKSQGNNFFPCAIKLWDSQLLGLVGAKTKKKRRKERVN